MPQENVTFETLDLSDRLRFLMVSYKLSVSEMADAAGVSKSAMEKYLAGPSSPRATSIVALCVNLGINAEWLLFGQADEDLTRVRDFALDAFMNLIEDLVETQSRDDQRISLSDPHQRALALSLASDRAQELQSAIANDRVRTRQQRASGIRVATIGPFPLRTSTSETP
ncbi:helix-turn-helix domain-containing protein [Paenirhodobacter populi]|uniref:Helix-turn-helix domain-containing protein n=1 Tax=Paenirhodobacter populi TaxID=2306993 RepID=A0A443JSI8_9RHOB|nr:helix-turn-helix transcriptional regulator [Sinirhodobacter populi]RWR23465.1 helix-turn-helix domain-containing protein [Sinirhodobacter populi]